MSQISEPFDGQLPADFTDEPLPFDPEPTAEAHSGWGWDGLESRWVRLDVEPLPSPCVLSCGHVGMCTDGHGTFWPAALDFGPNSEVERSG